MKKLFFLVALVICAVCTESEKSQSKEIGSVETVIENTTESVLFSGIIPPIRKPLPMPRPEDQTRLFFI